MTNNAETSKEEKIKNQIWKRKERDEAKDEDGCQLVKESPLIGLPSCEFFFSKARKLSERWEGSLDAISCDALWDRAIVLGRNIVMT